MLFEDETILRLLPELRRAWSRRGEQARVPITGRNDKCILFGTINPRTGHRVVAHGPKMGQLCFQNFLRLLRRSYRDRAIWMILDEASCHIASRSRALAKALNVVLIWLPKQCSELNAMDQLWRELKSNISANYQYRTVDRHAALAERWVRSLSRNEALCKASVFSEDYWLKPFLTKLS